MPVSSKKEEQKTNEKAILTYKDKPLARSGNIIYYGHPGEKFVIVMKILSSKEIDGMTVADKVSVNLLNTSPDAKPNEKIVRKVEKKGLYSAMDIGSTWLDIALQEKAE